MFNGMFGKIAPGMCRLSVSGGIAIKTGSGYKVYQMKTGRLTNCDNFVFDIGEEFFFVIPTNKVRVGDIILASGKPKCVIRVEKELLTVINYEDSTVESLLPEHHVFMGSTYFYGKIVSMFGNHDMSGKRGSKRLLKYMMLSEILKGNGNKNESGMGNLLPLLLLDSGKKDSLFDGIFDFDEDDEEEDKDSDD